MPSAEEAQSYVSSILSLLDSKQSQADAIVNEIKKHAVDINGVPYIKDESSNSQDLISIISDSYGNIIDPSPIVSAKSSVIDVPVTACPTTPPPEFPKYSQSEINKVVADVAAECETRGVPSPLLRGVSLKESIAAKCDITAPVILEPATFLPTPPFGAVQAAAGESPYATTTEPKDSLKRPAKTIIILEDLTKLSAKGVTLVDVTPLKKVGDRVSCGEAIMKVGNKTLTSPINSGIIKKIHAAGKAAKNQQLVTIEDTSTDDPIGKTLSQADDISKKLNDVTSLKDQLGKMEHDLWTKKIILGIYEGQLQGYLEYYKSFTALIQQRDDLSSRFVANTETIKKLLGGSLNYSTLSSTGSKGPAAPIPSADNIKKADSLLKDQQDLATQINTINSQITVLQKSQPTYFTIDGSTGSLASAEKTTSGNSIEYKLVPLNPMQKSKPALRQSDVLTKLGPTVLSFTNNLLFNGSYTPDKWNEAIAPPITTKGYNAAKLDIDINHPGSFSYNKILSGSGDFNFVFRISNSFRSIPWRGSLYQSRKDFYDAVTSATNDIKNKVNTDSSAKKLNDLRTQERLLPLQIQDLANKVYDQVIEVSKQFGYYQIYQSSIYLQRGADKTAELTKQRDDAKAIFDADYTVFQEILKKLADVEAAIDDFPITLQKNFSGGCVLPDASDPTCLHVEGEAVNMIKWPKSSVPLPTDDDNYRGNPQPNSPPITEFSYWQKYCAKATVVNLLPTFWPIGLLIPTPAGLLKIPLPIIWTPFAVIPTPFCVLVIGLALCGICPAPFVYVVNPGWPFPISVAGPQSSWHVTGIRGPQQIAGLTTSTPLPAFPKITIPLKYTVKGVTNQQPVTIDAAPYLTKLLPFSQDDLPPYERLTLSNLPYILYLTKWCAAGKKTMGFFENP